MGKLPEVVIAERDATIYEMKKAGMSFRQIGAALNISTGTAHGGFGRMAKKINNRMAIDHAAEARLDLERIDGMLASALPMTRPQKIQTPDGEEINIPPNLDAMDRVLKMIDRRSKMMGYDTTTIDLTVNQGSGSPDVGPKKSLGEKSPEQESKDLLKVFKEAGIFSDEAVAQILAVIGHSEIIDAEVVGEGEERVLLELEAEPEGPPEWIEEDDDFPDAWEPS